MNLSLAERKRQLEVLFKAGMIAEAVYRARLAALDAEASASQPPRPSGGQPAQARRYEPSGGRPQQAQRNNRPNRPEFIKAPYRFVPFDKMALVMAEPAALEGFDVPKADGLCAEIIVHWEAEGPLLVGEETKSNTGGDVVVPMSWKDANGNRRGDYFLPGSTLRGAIRSIAEILGGGRLARAHVNTNHAFGLRDFTHSSYSNSREDIGVVKSRFQLADPRQLKAGWLRLADPAHVPDAKGDEAMLRGAFVIEPVPHWYRLEAENLWRSKRPSGRATNASDFTKLTMAEKYAAYGLTGKAGGKEFIATAGSTMAFQLAASSDAGNGALVGVAAGGAIKGHLVFSGSSPSGKTYEYVFAGAAGAAQAIEPPFWQRFVRTFSEAVKDRLKPAGAWEKLPDMFRANPGMKLPVFYVGDLANQREEDFAFGVTRLFKVPHTHTLSDVMTASGVDDPVSSEQGHDGKTSAKLDQARIDMVDALFGFVYEPPGAKAERGKQDTGEVARKGRVAFSSARLLNGSKDGVVNTLLTETIETVMMGPRPSFAPFYLAGKVKDYSAETVPTIAGRKRYPVRTHGVGPHAAFTSVKSKLEEQVRAIQRMNKQGRGPSEDTKTRLRFLLPKQGADNLVFEGRIRLHNVTRAELGLVLEALTLGGNGHLRHALGRAKPFGAGQMKLTIAALTVEMNAAAGVTSAEPRPFVDAFRAHVAAGLGTEAARRSHAEALKVFFATCNPETGAQLEKAGKLDYLRLRELPQGGNRDENPYVRLRDMVKPMKNAADPTTPARLLTITGS